MTERQLPSRQPVLPSPDAGNPLFPGQVLYVQALDEQVGVRVTLSTQERAARIRALNTAEWLNSNFNDAANEDARLIYIKEAPDGFVGAKEATAGYGKPDVLIYAFDGEILDRPPHEEQPAKYIYDYDPETQVSYWGEVRRVLDCMEERLPEGLSARVIEHNFPIVSNEHHNVPRSICLPHTHVFAHGNAFHHTPEEQPAEINKLRHNEELLLDQELMVDGVLLGVHGRMLQQLGDDIPPLDVRHLVRPFGYEFYIPRNTSNEEFARLMREHHLAYAQTLQEVGPMIAETARINNPQGARILPQPSYIFYMRNDGDKQILSFSPQFVEAAGGMEGAGVALRRSGYCDPPPHPMTAQEIDALVL